MLYTIFTTPIHILYNLMEHFSNNMRQTKHKNFRLFPLYKLLVTAEIYLKLFYSFLEKPNKIVGMILNTIVNSQSVTDNAVVSNINCNPSAYMTTISKIKEDSTAPIILRLLTGFLLKIPPSALQSNTWISCASTSVVNVIVLAYSKLADWPS